MKNHVREGKLLFAIGSVVFIPVWGTLILSFVLSLEVVGLGARCVPRDAEPARMWLTKEVAPGS